MASHLGQKINKLRKSKGLTLDELADLTDSSKGYIWELENKKDARPSAEKISRIAAALGTTTEYFLNDKIKNSGPNELEQAFFRKFQTLDGKKKEQLTRILDILDNEE